MLLPEQKKTWVSTFFFFLHKILNVLTFDHPLGQKWYHKVKISLSMGDVDHLFWCLGTLLGEQRFILGQIAQGFADFLSHFRK